MNAVRFAPLFLCALLVSCVNGSSALPAFSFGSRVGEQAFEVELVNLSDHVFCIAQATWPNDDGFVGIVSGMPFVKAAPPNDYAKGFSAIGHSDRDLRILPGESIVATLRWSDFDRPAEIDDSSQLVMTIYPRHCKYG